MTRTSNSNKVAIVRTNGQIGRKLSRAIELCGGLGEIKSPVLVKPNICTINPETKHTVSDAALVYELVKLILSKDEGLSIRIVESDSNSKYADEAFEKFGYARIVDELTEEGYDIGLRNLSNSTMKKMEFEGEYYYNPKLPEEIVDENYFISVAIPKTHYLTYITGALKNQFGLLPEKDQKSFHPKVDDLILDFNKIVQPNLCIVDGRVGIESWDGPDTKYMGILIVGKDPVAVDSVMARTMGLDPANVPHLMAAYNNKLGTLNPEVAGEDIQSVMTQFTPPR